MPCRNTFLKYPVIICIFLSTEHLHTQCQFNASICLHAWWHISNSSAAILIYLTSENSMSKTFTVANCKSVKCSAHLGNYLLLSLITSPTHLALWLNRVEPTGNFPFLERHLIHAVSFNERPFSARCCTWRTHRLLATDAGQGHQYRLTKDRGLPNPTASALFVTVP